MHIAAICYSFSVISLNRFFSHTIDGILDSALASACIASHHIASYHIIESHVNLLSMYIYLHVWTVPNSFHESGRQKQRIYNCKCHCIPFSLPPSLCHYVLAFLVIFTSIHPLFPKAFTIQIDYIFINVPTNEWSDSVYVCRSVFMPFGICLHATKCLWKME